MSIIADKILTTHLSELSLEKHYENAPAGLISFLSDGRIHKINNTLLTMLGYQREELLGVKKIHDLFSVAGKIYFQTNLFPLIQLAGFTNEVNLDLVRKNREVFPGLLNVVEIKASETSPVTYMASVVDISERKKYEQELIAAKERAEDVSQDKAEFLATLSHEIRTPLNAILGIANLFKKTRLTPTQEEYAHLLLRTSENLLELVNNLMDLSKIEADKIKLEQKPFIVSDLTKILIHLFHLRCQEKNINLHIEVDPKVPNRLIGDPVKLNQIFINLISNAIKFTKFGFVKLKISVLSQTKDHVSLSFRIIDTGMGIPQDKIEIIFKEFTQASYDVNQTFGGSGLGLSISRKLVNMHSGELKVHSEEGKGSVFSFEANFSIDKSPMINKESATFNMDSEKKPTNSILIVDDSRMNVYILSEFLKTWNVSFDSVNEGSRAVEAIKNKHYDVILMDLNMPKMDGYQASKAIRQLNLEKQPVIIAFSAMDHQEVILKIREAGINDFARKPFRPEELNEILSEYLGDITKGPKLDLAPPVSME